MDHVLRTAFTIPRPIDEVFTFFAEAANLERITPPELNFHILLLKPAAISAGTLIDYRLRLFGWSFGWRSEITVWDPPHRFVDRQVKGPYRLWIHTHRFSEVEDGTIIEDEVRYELPLRPLGEIAHPLLRLHLERIFHYREKAIRKILLGQGPPGTIAGQGDCKKIPAPQDGDF